MLGVTPVGASVMVPVVVIGPPRRPGPVPTEVTVPAATGWEIQVRPDVQEEQAMRTWPLVPAGSAVKVEGPVAARIWPLVVNEEQGMAAFAVA